MRRLLLLALLACLITPAVAGAARRAPCTPGASGGPKCTWWKAKVTFVADGDTVRARIEGGPVRDIRLTGINAMELSVYSRTPSRRRGDCHGVEATNLLDRAISRANGRVRLAAQSARSASGRRLRRSVWVKAGGRLVDLSALSLQQGLALWLPNGVEYAHNRVHATLAAQAVAARRNLYDPAACRRGPDDDVPLTVAVHWDADSNDERNLDDEWIDVRNRGTRAVDLSGWWVRDSFLRRDAGRRQPGRVFPAGTVVPPGQAVRVRVGCGGDSVLDQSWCQDGSVFENVTGRPRDLGDGAYLFDPDGDLRASFLYPCLTGCVDPAAGRVRVVAHPNRPESMTVVNTSGAPVDLSGHLLKYRNRGKPNSYAFSEELDGVVAPGGSVSWTPDGNRFADGGGVVELRTLDDVLTDCVSWGFGALLMTDAWRANHPWATVYDFIVERSAVGGVLWKVGMGSDIGKLYRAAEAIGRLPDGAAVLDIPCGGGVALRGARRGQDVRYVAADIAPAMLERTRAEAEKRGVAVELREADAGNLPFADGEFDLAVSFTGLHCFPDPERAVHELARVLKPGGGLTGSAFLTDSGVRFAPMRAIGRAAGLLGPSGSRDDLERWLRDAGFTDIGLDRSGGLTYFTATRG